jgi:RecJ-like exonuclease
VRAVGYCSPWEICPDCKDKLPHQAEAQNCQLCQGKGLIKSEHPCPGHATPEEAEEHYKQYLLDHSEFYSKTKEWPKDKCNVAKCENEGTIYGRMGNNDYLLCDLHATKEALSDVYGQVGQIWSSY